MAYFGNTAFGSFAPGFQPFTGFAHPQQAPASPAPAPASPGWQHFGGPTFNFHSSPPPFATGPPHHHRPPHARPFYSAPEEEDFEAEERAALEHLRAIRQRREAAALAAERERQIREEVIRAAQREAQREAALERQKAAREEAIRQAIATEVRRQEIVRERQRQHEALLNARRQAFEQHHAQQRAIQQQRQQERQAACARRCARPAPRTRNTTEDVEGMGALSDFIGSLFGLQHDEPAAEFSKAAAEKPKTDATPAPATESKPEEPKATEQTEKTTATDETKEVPLNLTELINNFLGMTVSEAKDGESSTAGSEEVTTKLNDFLSQFGLVFEPTSVEVKDSAEATPATEKKTEEASSSAPEFEVTVEIPETPVPAAATPAPVEQTTKQPAPAPAAEATKAPAAEEEKKKEATAPFTPFSDYIASQAAQADLPPFLRDIAGQVHSALEDVEAKQTKNLDNKDLPPFLRDILTNIQQATKTEQKSQSPKEQVDTKGKGVAEGEKPATAKKTPSRPASPKEATSPKPKSKAPTPARTPSPKPAKVEPAPAPAAEPTTDDADADAALAKQAALDKLRDISQELHLAVDTFTFPAKLTFAATPSTDVTPPLLFNKGNSAYHAQAHKLLQLLLAADGVSSNGDREVRKQRKAVVKAVEGAIEQLEAKRDQVWAETKERRASGLDSDDEGSVSSWISSDSVSPARSEDKVVEGYEVL